MYWMLLIALHRQYFSSWLLDRGHYRHITPFHCWVMFCLCGEAQIIKESTASWKSENLFAFGVDQITLHAVVSLAKMADEVARGTVFVCHRSHRCHWPDIANRHDSIRKLQKMATRSAQFHEQRRSYMSAFKYIFDVQCRYDTVVKRRSVASKSCFEKNLKERNWCVETSF